MECKPKSHVLREKNKLRQILGVLVCAITMCLAACGGGGDSGGDTPNGTRTYYSQVGGVVSGLPTGSSLILSLNSGSQSLPITANGSFKFPTLLPFDSSYSVAVSSQSSGASCRVFDGIGSRTGKINSDGSNVEIYSGNVSVNCYPTSTLYNFENGSIGDLSISTWGVSTSASSGLPSNSTHAGNYVLRPNSGSAVSTGSCTSTSLQISRSVNRIRFDFAISANKGTLRFYIGSILGFENYGKPTSYLFPSGSRLREFDGNNDTVNWMHYDSGPLNLGQSIYHFDWIYSKCGPANGTDLIVIDNLVFE